MKVAFLTSFNTDLLKRECSALAEKKFPGKFEFWWHGYGQYNQSVLDSGSGLFTFNPDIVIIHLEIENLVGDAFSDPLLLNVEGRNALINSGKTALINIIEILTSRIPKCRIICENFISRGTPYLGVYDANTGAGNNAVTAGFNSFIAALTKEYAGRFFINDYLTLVSEYGKSNWFDMRMYRLAKQPFSYKYFPALAAHYLDAASLLACPRKKCIITDLDNTLWGGIVGQEGVDNIQLGNPGIGEAYVSFQKVLLNFYRQGVFLAVCSKNNYDDAIEAIEKHPDMILRKEYFSSLKINWLDKACNIKEIADELNIGTDSLVFIDDNPAECELVKQQMPEVEVINLTGDPDNYIAQLLNYKPLQAFALTAEDMKRNAMFRQDIKRREYESGFTDLDDFYRSLGMKGFVSVNSDSHISRAAQLSQKTNQFTLTTRGYSAEVLKELIEKGECRVYTLKLEDKFGDNGIIAVAIVKPDAEKMHIDSFLMSCRVIGRQAENLLMQCILEDAYEMGRRKVTAEFIKTKKNLPAEKFLPDCGFVLNNEGLYQINLPVEKLNHYIELIRD